MPAAAPRNSPTLQISSAQLALGILVQVVLFSVALGGLFQRVSAQETITQPLARGDLVKVEERTQHIQADVAWIRARMEKSQ